MPHCHGGWGPLQRFVGIHKIGLHISFAVGDTLSCASSGMSGRRFEVQEVGIMAPQECPSERLVAGQVGYTTIGLKNVKEALIGDTFFHFGDKVVPLPGFKKAKSKVFAGVFPEQPSEYSMLKDALEKLSLNDSSVAMAVDNRYEQKYLTVPCMYIHVDTSNRHVIIGSVVLGSGWNLGFLGTLHMDVFQQRLEKEFCARVIFTAPTVLYKVVYKNNAEKFVSSVAEFPSSDEMPLIERIEEPTVLVTIIVPEDSVGRILSLCLERRGVQVEMSYLDSGRAITKFKLPLAEVIVDFFDQVQSITSGFATFDYEESGYEAGNVVKVNCLLNKEPVPDLSLICHQSKSQEVGRRIVQRLKELVERQQFEVAIQAAVGGKIVARENIPPYRKDVTAKLVCTWGHPICVYVHPCLLFRHIVWRRQN